MCEQQQVSAQSKPHHVRKLQFAQAILRLNSVADQAGQDTKGRLIIDDEISRIPCTSKLEFVQEWIDTHGNYPVDPADNTWDVDDPECLSDTMCEIENSVGSPVLGKLKKGHLKRPSVYNCTSSAKKLFSQSRKHIPDQSRINVLSDCNNRKFVGRKPVDDNQNFDGSESDHFPLQPKDTNIQNSPILGSGQKRRNCRRVSYQRSNKAGRLETQVQSERNASEVSVEKGPPAKRPRVSTVNCNNYGPDGIRSNVILESRKESSTEDIEDSSSTDAKSNKHGNTSRLSMVIEDSETEDLDATYFSNVENCKPPAFMSVCSQRISSAASTTNQRSESVAISTVASPARTPSDVAVLSQPMDAGKKRKKPKKGSLVERLQLLINNERSSVRIWRHYLKHPPKKDITDPYVVIYVQSCALRFDKQLLEGIVVEDSANLLPPDESTANHESKPSRPRNISLLITPELTGKIAIAPKRTFWIAPPWMLLDSQNLLLSVSYMTPALSKSITDVKTDEFTVPTDGSTILEKFSCSCNLDSRTMTENSLWNQCVERSNEPHVLETLITSDK